MTKRAQLPDGTILEFPDGATDEVMDRAVKAHIANPANDSRAKGFVGGTVKPVDNIAALASRIPVVGPAVDQLGQALGMPSTDDAVANNNAMRANNSRTGYQMLGNIAGTLPTARLPGGAAAQGAVSGALLTDSTDLAGILRDAALGAGGGKIAQGVGNAIGAVAAPRISAGARRLANAGILQTPGQILAGGKGLASRILSKGEEALTSTPILGDMITMAREGGTEAYNRALGNRVLGNIGKQLPARAQPGEKFVSGIRRTVSDQYDRLVPNLVGSFDRTFADDLQKAKDLTNVLPDNIQQQFERIVRNAFTNRSQGTSITGQALKDAESKLTGFVRQYTKSSDADQRILGDALKATREALRGLVVRSNPAHAQELQSLNRSWAMLRPMKSASEDAPDRVITPQRMFQAQRRTGINDPLINTAAARLTNRTPDSGTPRRAMAAIAGANALGAGAAAMINPALAAPALLTLLYTKPGMQALNKAVFAPRGPVAQAVGKGARALPALAPALGPLGVMSLLGRFGD